MCVCVRVDCRHMVNHLRTVDLYLSVLHVAGESFEMREKYREASWHFERCVRLCEVFQLEARLEHCCRIQYGAATGI